MTNKTALITGGAGGIGRELAKLFATDNHNIIAVDVQQQGLDDLGAELAAHYPNITYYPMKMDLSTMDAAENVLAWCEAKNLSVDVLVNNVGFGLFGEHVDIPVDRISNMLMVNNMLLTKLSYHFGGLMKQRGAGKILNVASLAGYSPLPFFTAYSATKAYTLAFSVGLARELEEYGVTVTCLSPGTTKTAFLDTAQTGVKSATGVTKFAKAYQITPDIVAKAGYKALQEGKLTVLPTFFLHLQSIFFRVLPLRLVSWLAYKQAKT